MGILIFIVVFIIAIAIINGGQKQFEKLPYWANLVISIFLICSPVLAYKVYDLYDSDNELHIAFNKISSYIAPTGLKLLKPIEGNRKPGIYGGCATVLSQLSEQSIEELNKGLILSNINKNKALKEFNWEKTTNLDGFGAGWAGCPLANYSYSEIMRAARSDVNGLYSYYNRRDIVALPSIGILIFSEEWGR